LRVKIARKMRFKREMAVRAVRNVLSMATGTRQTRHEAVERVGDDDRCSQAGGRWEFQGCRPSGTGEDRRTIAVTGR
jgi:hypothetical protein